MIGDSSRDIDMARAARVPIIAVDFGYSETPVTNLAPDRTISHFIQLPETVNDLCGLNQHGQHG
jgi:phosphoglycolate phosphatase